MSSSTSNFNQIPKVDIRVWGLSVLLSGLFLLPIIGLTLTVDPFNSRVVSRRLNLDRYTEFRSRDVAQWAGFEIARDLKRPHQDVEILLLGDSRMRQLTGGLLAPRLRVSDGREAYNLSFGGASIYEQIDFFWAFHRDFPNAKTVIWQIDYFKMRERAQTKNNSDYALRNAKYPFLYATSTKTISDAAKWVAEHGLLQHFNDQPIDYLPALGDKIEERCQGQISRPLQSEIDVYQNYARVINSDGAVRVYEEVMIPFVKEIEEQGYKVYFYMPPLPVESRQQHTAEFTAIVEDISGRLARDQRLLDIDATQFDDFSWLDAFHVCPDDALRVLDWIVPTL